MMEQMQFLPVSKPDILSNPLVLFGTMYSIRSLPAADKGILLLHQQVTIAHAFLKSISNCIDCDSLVY
jgi:hypothetical protein